MKKGLNYIVIFFIALTSCKNNDINVFDKTADERVAEAIANLKTDLTAPANGFKLKYKPVPESGSFYVLMKFNDDNSLILQTDLNAKNGELLTDTVTYRIDSSLGLQLIIENYSFFSYLFEQNDASYGAEYEFIYVNKPSDNTLVFKSKTDTGTPTILTFEEASAADQNSLLGLTLSNNLNTLSKDLNKITTSLKLTYLSKDLIFYISMNEAQRIITFTSASKKTNTASTTLIDFTTGYLIKKDSMVLETALSGSFLGNSITIKGIKFNSLNTSEIDACTNPIPTHLIEGVTSANHAVTLETSLLDVGGKTFTTVSTSYYTPLVYIYNNGVSAKSAITTDIKGAAEFELYYNLRLSDGTKLYGIGFYIINDDQSTTTALREFTPVLTNNNLVFNFKPGFRLFGNTNPSANLDNINIYLDALSSGDQTYVYKITNGQYEFYNPCTGWSFVMINPN